MRSLILFSAFSMLIACSSASKKPDANPKAMTSVEVKNENLLDMTIYVYRGDQRFRLGLVPSHSSRVFAIPDHMIAGIALLRFLADPIGGRSTPITEEVPVTPGEQALLIIRNF